MSLPDRTTPVIRVRLVLPGKPSPERMPQLEDLPGNASRVMKLTFEDNEKAVDKVTLEINNYDLRFPDDPIFDRGNTLVLQWGYPGDLSPARELTVVNWLPGPVFKVEGHVKTAVAMNRLPVDQTYYGMKISDVVQIIAERNGFGPAVRFIEATHWTCESIVQPNYTDAQFLRELAKDYGMVFFVDASGFHWHSRAFGQQPRKVWEYFPSGRGDLLAFPSFEAAPAAQPGAITLKGTDAKTGKPIEVRADNASTAGRDGLASTIEVIDVKTSTTALRPNAGREAVAHTSATSVDEAKAKASQLYKKATGVPVRCTAPVMGDPQFQAKTIVTLKGIGQRLSGNYYAIQATHTVEPGRYTMSVKLVRDGTNGAGGASGSAAKSDAKANTQPAASGNALQPVEVIDTRTSTTRTTFKAPGPTGGNQ